MTNVLLLPLAVSNGRCDGRDSEDAEAVKGMLGGSEGDGSPICEVKGRAARLYTVLGR